jgi:hypothetical protein
MSEAQNIAFEISPHEHVSTIIHSVDGAAQNPFEPYPYNEGAVL